MNRALAILVGLGCLVLVLLVLAVGLFFVPVFQAGTGGLTEFEVFSEEPAEVIAVPEVQDMVPTLTVAAPREAEAETAAAQEPAGAAQMPTSATLNELYHDVNPGVVNIRVFTEDLFGGGAGSGFILDDAGHIVTNNHVVAGADSVTVIYFNGLEAEADVIGTDDDSDLAIIQAAQLPDMVYPLRVANSELIDVGDWVVAIGNPFGFGSSMSIGIVSAVGRTIPSGVTPFSIPQAIQTDAAINPGNSGGPLINLAGEVIGVNAQIRTAGERANSGVGFAIPSNVVRRVAPSLIETGNFQWPWLGIEGGSVNRLIAEANGLDTQRGAFISRVEPGGPAEEAGLQGSTGTVTIEGQPVPVGGDVVIAANGEPVVDFNDLLGRIAFMAPGEELALTVVRDGEVREITVTLRPRPETFDSLGQ